MGSLRRYVSDTGCTFKVYAQSVFFAETCLAYTGARVVLASRAFLIGLSLCPLASSAL